MVRKNDSIQILRPQGEGDFFRRVILSVGGNLFAVNQIKAGDQLADQAAGLASDIALAVNQQFVQKRQRLRFLPHGQIGKIFLKNVEVGPQLLPAFGGTGFLDDIAELLLVGQHMHQPHVVIHRQKDQAVQRLLRAHQRGVFVRSGRLRMSCQIDIHSKAAHIVLEVVELSIDEFIPSALILVHIVQLG